jgi:predicted nucleic acid-binding protein
MWKQALVDTATPIDWRQGSMRIGRQAFNRARKLLASFVVVDFGGRDIAVHAAKNFRALRALGITVRKTVDTIIATCCIERGWLLLYSDRDFDPFVEHLGLQSAM